MWKENLSSQYSGIFYPRLQGGVEPYWLPVVPPYALYVCKYLPIFSLNNNPFQGVYRGAYGWYNILQHAPTEYS